MEDGRKNNGGSRKGAGRKSKDHEHKLAEKLNPMNDIAMAALRKGLEDNQSWAVKLFLEYLYGKPGTTVDMTTNGNDINTVINLGSGIKPPNE